MGEAAVVDLDHFGLQVPSRSELDAWALRLDELGRLGVLPSVAGHDCATSMPIERAVPSMIFAAWSTSCAFRSGIFLSAI